MSTPDTSHAAQEPQHSPEEASRWFAQWHLYRSIVDANWMCHQEIFRRYDPGCFCVTQGRSRFWTWAVVMRVLLRGRSRTPGFWAYTGADASASALTKARDELAGTRFPVQLREADMLVALEDGTGAPPRTFEVILASYSVHHLPVAEKLRFFKGAFSKLEAGGSLLFADVFRRDGETGEQYMDAYVAVMRESWGWHGSGNPRGSHRACARAGFSRDD